MKLNTKLMGDPISYQLTLHKLRLDSYYGKYDKGFIDEYFEARKGNSLCVHMNNLINTYGKETILEYIEIFLNKRVG